MASIQTSLTGKVLWVIAGLSLVLVVLVSAIEIHQQGEDLIAEQQREAAAVVMANRDALSLSLWSLDQRSLETLARSLVRGTSIFRAEVMEDGKVQLRVSREALNADRSWQIPLFRPGSRTPLGFLRLYENYDQDRQQMRRNAAMLVMGELTKALALSLIVFFLVHIWITRPLAQLAAKVQDNAAGGAGGPIAIQRPLRGGRDEIDALIDAVNYNQQARRRLEAEADLRRAREAQTGKLAALGQLAGGIAHDFNNILGAILGFGGLLAQDTARGSPADHYIQRMLAAAERGRDLVKEILAFARAGDVDRSIVDLSQIVRQSENLLLAALPKSTSLAFAYSGEALPVSGNGVRLGQLIVNLCINASEALGGRPGTVTLEVSRAPPGEAGMLEARSGAGELFSGTADPARDYARLRVSDSGEGIAPELLDRIFEPFFTTKGRHHGTGLGLAVVHGVVESHGGACHIASHPGSGSIFTIYLPLSDLPAVAPSPPQSVQTTLGGHERLLIVDDEVDLVDMLVRGFERLGYEAVGVSDPREALAAFLEEPQAFDVVITDQVMPAMSGLELTRKLKSAWPGMKVILCTGYSDNLTEKSARAAGVDMFHIKPVDAFGLAASIRALIDGPAIAAVEGAPPGR